MGGMIGGAIGGLLGGGGGGGINMEAESRKIMEMQKQQSLENMRIQAQQAAQTERLATISNMLKNKHQSQMTIINNMKS